MDPVQPLDYDKALEDLKSIKGVENLTCKWMAPWLGVNLILAQQQRKANHLLPAQRCRR